ncbi:hypothetical protein THIOKS12210025 [Thiocapsa sp. KS1]|nr:type II toxin-antitoxin system RelE/ParE family toxin [Thiocapsa sp. KS1]CRI64980.1 hypothetical protein THIOKS12210025 [Thiocapsa sp. KS1]
MASYRIKWTESALQGYQAHEARHPSAHSKRSRVTQRRREIRRLPQTDRGLNDLRIRVGQYRVAYTVADDRLIVEIVHLCHRASSVEPDSLARRVVTRP